MEIFIFLLLVTLFCQRGLGKKGKAAFREAFGQVAELRSCLESGTPLLALTATAHKEMRNRLIKCLGMKSGVSLLSAPTRITDLLSCKQTNNFYASTGCCDC